MLDNGQDGETIKDAFHSVEDNNLERLKTLIESGGVSPTITRGFGRERETLAHAAAKRGNLDILKYIVDQNPSILSDDLDEKLLGIFDQYTILETAVMYGHLHVVKYLVENHGDDIFRQRHYLLENQSPVGLATCRGHLNIIKYFVEERHVNVDTGKPHKVSSYCYTDGPLLFLAYLNNRHNITNYLIGEKKANLTVVGQKNRNILYNAVYKGDLNFINKYILDEKKANIDINWRDDDGRTLLYTAVAYMLGTNNVDVVQYLVEQKKADVNIPEYEENQTPLHEATKRGSYEVFKFLVDHGSDLEKKNKDGATPLHLAAAAISYFSDFDEFDKKFQYLLQHGANVKERNNKGETTIDIILRTKRTKASKYLIDYMEDVNVRDDKGETLLHKVATLNQTELLDYLVSTKHAKVDVTRAKDEWTPLHCAALRNHLAVCKYLVEHGANPLVKDKAGRNPAQVASKGDVINLIENASSPEARNRRSVSTSIGMSAPELQSHERTLDQVSGHLNGRATITSVNETRPALHFHSFLLLTNFFARYLFFSARTSTDENNYLSTAEDNQNRMDHLAQVAVHNFVEISSEEMYN